MEEIAEEVGENLTPPDCAFYNETASESTDNASITVSFAENDMEALAVFSPATGSGAILTLDYIYTVLEKHNISYGIQQETIDNAILECNTEKKTLKSVVIAKGTLPADEVGEYMLLNPLFKQKKTLNGAESSQAQDQIPNKNKRIDYKEVSPFIIVKKGQVLAKLMPKKPGISGMNVHGTSIPYKVINHQGVEGGNNTLMEERCLLSAINGQMTEVKGVIHVAESLNIKGPVGYKTGNIAFPGDVIIEGPVSDGFKLYSGASILIKQTLDVTDAVAKGDLVVAGGIIGRGQALVKVGGNVKTKFIENCRIACRKTVFVNKEIINSRIYTLENIEMGEKSLIIGSEIYALNGIKGGSIGRSSSRASNIHCGIDFTTEQEKDKYNNMLRLLAVKQLRFKQLQEDPQITNEKKANLEAIYQKLEEDRHNAATKITELLRNSNINEKACVEVAGEIAAGTLIQICNASLYVTEPLRRVKITLDTTSGKLLTEKM